jgi:ABC-type sugar transport system ATPase subunit
VAGTPYEFRDPIAAQKLGIALVDQELSLAPDLSVQENMFLGSIGRIAKLGAKQQRRRSQELLAEVGLDHLDPRVLVENLALGERQLIEIARALGRDAKIIFLDEPTATLSESEIERVFEVSRRIAASGNSLVYISHRLGEVLELCDRVSVIRDGKMVATSSTDALSGRDELIRMMIDEELPPPTKSVGIKVEQHRATEVRALSVPPLVKDFGVTLGAGEIVGLTGQVGSGTSEVLRALGGLSPEARGVVVVDGKPVRLGSPTRSLRSGIAFISNDRKAEGLFLETSIRTNLLSTRLGHVSRFGFTRRRTARRVSRQVADYVKVDAERLPVPAGTLSGGNQQKVFIGRCLDRGDIKLLLLDEPTRGVDVAGRAEIHRLLREASLDGVTVVFASTEVDEIMELSTQVVTMFAGKIVASRDRSEVTAELISADMTMSREHSLDQASETRIGEKET